MKFQLFGKKHRLKTYKVKTPHQKAQELLEKAWLRDLQEHPEYAREIARQKFGLSPEIDEVGNIEAPPDLLDILRQAKEAKNLLKDEVGGEKGESIWSVLPQIMTALPSALEALKQMQGAQPPQLRQEAPPKQLPQQPPEKTQEEQLTEFAERFLSLEPEEAAQELYQNRDKEGDLRSIIWNVLTENDQISVDGVINMLPMLENFPQFSYMQQFANQLTTNKGKRWLALVIDEINRLNAPGNEVNNQ